MHDALIHSLQLDLTRLRELSQDVPEEAAAEQPAGLPNHLAWILGHLAHSMEAIAGELGAEPWLPAGWAHRFGTGSRPTTDRVAYPSVAVLFAALEDGVGRVVSTLETLPETAWRGDLPDERYRARYPTLGHAVTHVLGSHFSFHVGQLSCWRRARATASKET